jgi:hypothetical protein
MDRGEEAAGAEATSGQVQSATAPASSIGSEGAQNPITSGSFLSYPGGWFGSYTLLILRCGTTGG